MADISRESFQNNWDVELSQLLPAGIDYLGLQPVRFAERFHHPRNPKPIGSPKRCTQRIGHFTFGVFKTPLT